MDGLDRRLRRIEKKLGLEDEDIMQEFAKSIHQRLDRIDNQIRALQRIVSGHDESAMVMEAENEEKRY
jgi:hypothetical protein